MLFLCIGYIVVVVFSIYCHLLEIIYEFYLLFIALWSRNVEIIFEPVCSELVVSYLIF